MRPVRLTVLVAVTVAVAAPAAGCRPGAAEGQFLCDPTAPNPCPDGWRCVELHPSQGYRCYREWTGVCGNGIVEPGEECDDHNLDDFDGCSAKCRLCADSDGDGYPGPGCTDGEDHCDDEPYAWTPEGCAACDDADGDGLPGPGCDIARDCDDHAPGIAVPCQPVSSCPQGWIHVPAGSFEMGCNDGEPCWEDWSGESPRHPVTLSDYCIEPTEVSVAAFRECVDAGICTGFPRTTEETIWCNYGELPGDRERHPMNCVDWYDARLYCQYWLGGDLPTEAQWEKAARGTDQRVYPWGDEPPTDCSRTNWSYCYSSDAPATWEVGYLTNGAGDSYYGLQDMAGNVWEWTLDCYGSTFYETCAGGCTDPWNDCSDDANRVTRGGSFDTTIADGVRVVLRLSNEPVTKTSKLGFRCRRAP